MYVVGYIAVCVAVEGVENVVVQGVAGGQHGVVDQVSHRSSFCFYRRGRFVQRYLVCAPPLAVYAEEF